MFSNQKTFLLFFIILTIVNSNTSIAGVAESLQLIQILKDELNGVDGLDNPRNVKISADNSKAFVTSGDDNAFAVFSIDKDFKLTFSQVFKNTSADINGLEGASGIAYLDHGNHVIATGFYDGALTIFSENNNKDYRLSETISDGLSYERVFDSDIPVGKLDTLGLLGAWDVITSQNEKQVLVASYMSNAISILDVTPEGKVVFNRTIKDAKPLENSLGKAISLALSPLNDELYVLGFDEHQLTVFDRNETGKLSVKQVLKNDIAGVKQFLNPQKIVVSPNGHYLYVACSGSNSIVVFNKAGNGQYTFLQLLENQDIGGAGLEGASSLAISADGSQLYAAGEAGIGLYLFSAGVDGRLRFESKLLNAGSDELKGISSIDLTDDNRHILITAGKSDSLFVFKIISN